MQKVYDLLDNLPAETELMETKAGKKQYFSPHISPDGQPIFTVEDASGAPQTSYIPNGNFQAQDDYFRTRGGKYKGKIK